MKIMKTIAATAALTALAGCVVTLPVGTLSGGGGAAGAMDIPESCQLLPAEGNAVFAGVNAKRQAAGLAPVQRVATLDRAAQVQACYMAKTQSLGHTGAGGSSAGQRVYAACGRYCQISENVGNTPNIPMALQLWTESPGHRKNMMNRRYKQGGAAVARDANGRLWSSSVFARNC
ncbi:CAP domain-containing protein [Paracoccus sp. SCSIO 75233]|uniref:CAP domain-containing protein n=1 Tax=Paracoccus sp. SCSIO 75233 TaxID=3017782 RepID=UPI0022F034CB|nr:CAP domain-containing protein [Paracoccus sp. SCSIO 75233]WBU52324.1 CAP domain-containing protein [Paracoccus sp. SCSIO 75233]